MTQTTTLASTVKIAPRFQRSTNLAADFGSPAAINGYILSPLAQELVMRILRDLATHEGTRAWSIVGPYGSGKSSFVTFLSMLTAEVPFSSQAQKPIKNQCHEVHKEVRKNLRRIGGAMIPVLVVGSRIPLKLALLRGLSLTAKEYWSGRGAKPLIWYTIEDALERLERGRKVDDEAVVNLVVDFADKIVESHLGGVGLNIVIDEAGKILEWAAQHPEEGDIYLLQLLAEASNRFDRGTLNLVTVLHQNFQSYAADLPRSVRLEWTKIEGRFELVPYLESPQHFLKLISRAVRFDGKKLVKELYTKTAKEASTLNKIVNGNGDPIEEELLGCFPLHPVTALSLGPLFRTSLGQNERSLFAFLTSSEPRGFQEFIRFTDIPDAARTYCLDNLYDYLIANTGVRLSSGVGNRTWSATEQALSRLPSNAEEVDSKVVKAISILSLIGAQVGLRADDEIISLGVSFSKQQVAKSLRRLKEASVVVHREFKGAYQVWDGSDINVGELVGQNRERTKAKGELGTRLQKCFPPHPVVASRHYYETGTLRYLMPHFISISSLWGSLPCVNHGDGDLFYVVPDKKNELAEIEKVLKRQATWTEKRPKVIVLPAHPKRLIEAAEEYFGILDALDTTPELAGDPVARRELNERLLRVQDILTGAITESYGNERRSYETRWFVGGEEIETQGSSSAVASDVFDRVYHRSPRILNELVNRGELSSAAAAARRELLERMFVREHEERLGIEGHPPELSMYRSVLEITRLHRKFGDEWRFAPPRKGNAFSHTYAFLDEEFKNNAGKQISFGELMKRLAEPPFGMREGVSPLLLIAYYLTNRENLFVYEDGSFLPSPSADVAHRLLRKPQSITLQYINVHSRLGVVLKSLAGMLFSHNDGDKAPSLLSAVKAIVGVVGSLSDYASKTQRLSQSAKKVRNTIKVARDPVRLLLVELPNALGYKLEGGKGKQVENEARKFAGVLRNALKEIKSADRELEKYMDETICKMLGRSGSDTKLHKELGIRARRLGGVKEIIPEVRRFIDVTASLEALDETSIQEWLQAVGTAIIGKPPSYWNDSEVTHFVYAAMNVCQGFLATEQLLLESRAREGDAVHLIRVSILDSEGQEQNGVAVLRADETEKVVQFKKEVDRLAEEHGIQAPDLAYAVITSMMDTVGSTKKDRDEVKR